MFCQKRLQEAILIVIHVTFNSPGKNRCLNKDHRLTISHWRIVSTTGIPSKLFTGFESSYRIKAVLCLSTTTFPLSASFGERAGLPSKGSAAEG